MPTVIDSLVLNLGLDTTQFTKGEREAMSSQRKFKEQLVEGGKDIESQGKKLSEFFQGVKRQAIEVLGLFAGATGVKEFLHNVTTVNTALGYTAQRLNISAKEIGGWEGALQRIGAPAGTATAAFSGLNSAVYDFLLTGHSSIALLNRIGGPLDAAGKVKDLGQMFLEMSDYIHRSNMNTSEAVALLMKIPGMNEQMATMILKSRTEMEGMVTASEKAQKITPILAAEAQRATDRFELFKQAVGGSGNALMEHLYPALIWTVDKMHEMVDIFPALGVGFNYIGQIINGIGGIGSTALGAFVATKYGGSLFRLLSRGAGGIARGGAGLVRVGSAATAGIAGVLASAILLASTEPAGAGEDEQTAALRASAGGRKLPIKPGAGDASAAMVGLMRVLAGVPEIKEVTALDDAFHRKLGSRDPHAQGRAIDVTISNPERSAAVAEEIRAKLLAAGIDAKVLDEYMHPSPNATGGHLHIGIPPGARAAATAANIFNNRSTRASTSNDTTITAHIAEVNVNAPNVKNPNEAAAAGIGESLRRSGFAFGANWNPP